MSLCKIVVRHSVVPVATYFKSDGSDCPNDLRFAWDCDNPIYKPLKSFVHKDARRHVMIEQRSFPEACGDFTLIKFNWFNQRRKLDSLWKYSH